MRLANHTLHLVVGLNADQYAAEMRGAIGHAVNQHCWRTP